MNVSQRRRRPRCGVGRSPASGDSGPTSASPQPPTSAAAVSSTFCSGSSPRLDPGPQRLRGQRDVALAVGQPLGVDERIDRLGDQRPGQPRAAQRPLRRTSPAPRTSRSTCAAPAGIAPRRPASPASRGRTPTGTPRRTAPPWRRSAGTASRPRRRSARRSRSPTRRRSRPPRSAPAPRAAAARGWVSRTSSVIPCTSTVRGRRTVRRGRATAARKPSRAARAANA